MCQPVFIQGIESFGSQRAEDGRELSPGRPGEVEEVGAWQGGKGSMFSVFHPDRSEEMGTFRPEGSELHYGVQ